MFANAGVAKYAPFGRITEELYDSIFDINVKGLLFTVQKALPLLPDRASIILNASVVASKGLSSNSVYSATKAAVRSFARTWTTDLKDRGIRVNAVSPGSIDTPGLSDLLASSETGQQRKQMIAAVSGVTPIGLQSDAAKTARLRRDGLVALPEDLAIHRNEADRSLLAAKSMADLVAWSGGLYNPPARFRSW